MPLSERQKNLLHEIYEVPYTNKTTVTQGGGSSAPTLFDVQIGVKEQLKEGIAQIDLDESKCNRIAEILEEYESIALDFSTIDREGYSMRPGRNMRRIYKALYPYTGILFTTLGGNRVTLG